MKNSIINKKAWSFFIVFAIYALAFWAGFLIYSVSKYKINILLVSFIADIAATLIVWVPDWYLKIPVFTILTGVLHRRLLSLSG